MNESNCFFHQSKQRNICLRTGLQIKDYYDDQLRDLQHFSGVEKCGRGETSTRAAAGCGAPRGAERPEVRARVDEAELSADPISVSPAPARGFYFITLSQTLTCICLIQLSLVWRACVCVCVCVCDGPLISS